MNKLIDWLLIPIRRYNRARYKRNVAAYAEEATARYYAAHPEKAREK